MITITYKLHKMKRTLLLLMGLMFIILSTSCSKQWDTPDPIENDPQIQNTEITTLSDVRVPDNFNWKTVRDVEIKISGSSNGLVEAISSKGVVYQKAYLNGSQSYTMKLTVPTYESSIQLKKDGRSEQVSISSGNVSYTFN
ncbi:MAG: hypothetical protein CVU00_15640 [Bacteroidetes bacterium HGW-Bacteroidetes-17]|jgi:hypothetical protein|nr:MAG: hypothetical protein CVU00_15640 [Bacteroidetes bacterium HGW-Bacteroidetes-17]